MKILVTGGFGFIGSHFVKFAVDAGHDVMIVDALTYAGRSVNVDLRACTFSFADIRDALAIDRIFEAFSPDAVVHFAAETHVTRSITCATDFLTTNVQGTHVLLEASLRAAAQFVHISTDEVYGSLTPDEIRWNEHSPYAPRNPYAASKAASDHLVRAYIETFRLPAVIIHASNCYGPRQHPEKLIPTLIRQCRAGLPMTLHGDGMHYRDWLFVNDFVLGVYRALTIGKFGKTYNIPGQCERSNLAIANAIGACLSTPFAIELVPDRPGNDRRYAMSGTLAKDELGINSTTKIEAKLPEVFEWYWSNPSYGSQYGR